jgi:hypothetical protein
VSAYAWAPAALRWTPSPLKYSGCPLDAASQSARRAFGHRPAAALISPLAWPCHDRPPLSCTVASTTVGTPSSTCIIASTSAPFTVPFVPRWTMTVAGYGACDRTTAGPSDICRLTVASTVPHMVRVPM